MNDIPVMLVHGFASSYERNWREPGWADLLRDEDRRVIGVDLLGHGQAARPRDPAAYSSLEQSILAHDPALDRDNDGIGYRTEPSAERAERRDAARAHQPGAERRQRGDNDDAEHEITHDGENQRHDKVTRV